jgi:hypothetical protein
MVVPMVSKSRVGESLDLFIDDVGIPQRLRCDGATEMTGRKTEFQKTTRKCRTRMEIAKAGRHTQNHVAEREIGELKR